MTSRRSFLLGLGAALAAPAIVRAEVLMPVRKLIVPDVLGNVIGPHTHAAPEAWLPCDGRTLSRAMYADLFKAIGTHYGAGDGRTTFNLPDLTPRLVLRGPDAMPNDVMIWPLDTRIATRDDAKGFFPTGTISTHAPHPAVKLDDPRIEDAWWRKVR